MAFITPNYRNFFFFFFSVLSVFPAVYSGSYGGGGIRGGGFSIARGSVGARSGFNLFSTSHGASIAGRSPTTGVYSTQGRRLAFAGAFGGYLPLYHSRHMHRSVSANIEVCTDFYGHACGSWPEQYRDITQVLQRRIDAGLRELLENATRTEEATSFDVQLYRQCIKGTLSEDHLGLVGLLGEIGERWPILQSAADTITVSWTSLYAELTQLGVSPFFTVKIDGNNASFQAPAESLESSLTDWTEYQELVEEVAVLFASSSDDKGDYANQDHESDLLAQIRRLIDFARVLASLKPNYYQINTERLTLGELKHQTNWELQWALLLNQIQSTASERLSGVSQTSTTFTDDHWVSVDDLNYYRQVATLLRKTPPDTLLNYLSWKVIQAYGHLAGGPLRSLLTRYASLLQPALESRCLRLIKMIYPGRSTERYLASRLASKSTQSAVSSMIGEIKSQFVKTLSATLDSYWLPKDSASLAKELLREMDIIIGLPSWSQTQSTGFQLVNETRSILGSSQILARIRQHTLAQGLLSHKELSSWDLVGTRVRYTRKANQMLVPFALLQTPLFNESSPRVLNLAGLGSLITTEMIYGLRVEWWNPRYFNNLTVCLAADYKNTQELVKREQFQQLYNAEELISSDRAIRLLDALWKSDYWWYDSFEDKPDLFYLQLAQVHCANYERARLERHRVNLLFRNFPEFGKFYECSEGSLMTPSSEPGSCPLWTFTFTQKRLFLVGFLLAGLLLAVLVIAVAVCSICRRFRSKK